jgi:hypothetical protein
MAPATAGAVFLGLVLRRLRRLRIEPRRGNSKVRYHLVGIGPFRLFAHTTDYSAWTKVRRRGTSRGARSLLAMLVDAEDGVTIPRLQA